YPQLDPDRVHVIHNGIDPEIYRPQPSLETLARFGIDPDKPFALFNGRITRQKGLPLLLAAALKLDPRHQLVIVASSPDTPEIAVEGVTGYLVDYGADRTERFTPELAGRIAELLSDPARARKMGKAGRDRAVKQFGWPAIATRTVELYDKLLSARS